MNQKQIDTILILHSFILNDATLTERHLNAIREAAPGAKIAISRNREDWNRLSGDIASKVEVVFGLRPASLFKEMPNIRWAQQTGAGANWLLDAPEVVQSDMILTNASGVHAIPIAEHILALMLTLSRGIQHSILRQAGHKWERRGRITELDGATLGLIGVGKIGEKTAEKAKGLNMRVLGMRRASPHIDKMYGPDGLKDLLEESDWVVITAALTAETMGMIGEEQFKAMKESAFIINIGRGPIIQEKAMIKALQKGWIAGAGLDVFEQEPLPEDSPLWDMKNVVITPHYAGATPHYVDRLIEIFTENLKRYQAGLPLINVVDKKLGY
ncbi:MAG: D-2-hydroxyacid dehydrogenase [Deltaproteobacteria bacterium]|nr:D-2-hydroxyacid dehydrogenase [Deltaproteobacteria bacterium]